MQKLGWGHFSTVWLVNNNTTDCKYALKIQKSKESYQEAACDELNLLSDLKKSKLDATWLEYKKEICQEYGLAIPEVENYNIEIIDNFVHYGMHGKHYCSVFEIMGPSLLDVVQYYENDNSYRCIPMRFVKLMARQILIGLDYMHRVCNLIHTDLKLENVMI